MQNLCKLMNPNDTIDAKITTDVYVYYVNWNVLFA